MATMQEIMEAVKDWWGQIPNVQDGNVQTQPQLPLQFSTQPAGYQHPDDYSGYAATHPGSIRTKQSGVGSIVQQNMGPEALTDKSEFGMDDASNPTNTEMQKQAQVTPKGGIGGSENTDKTPFNFGKLLRGILPIAIPTVAGAVLGSRSGTFGPLAGGLYGLAAGASGATERQHEMAQLKQKEIAERLKYYNEEKNRILREMEINKNDKFRMAELARDLQKQEFEKKKFEQTYGLDVQKHDLEKKKYESTEKRQGEESNQKLSGPFAWIATNFPGLDPNTLTDEQIVSMARKYEQATKTDPFENQYNDEWQMKYGIPFGKKTVVDPVSLKSFREGLTSYINKAKGMRTTSGGNTYFR